MREYFDEPALTQATLRDGWLLTGDIGYLDATASSITSIARRT